MQAMSKENIIKALRDKKAIFENEEKKIVDNFNSSGLSLDDYVSNFRENRKQIAKYKIIMKRIE